MSSPILERLAESPIVFDGAMGTLLYSRGVFINRNFDELNLSRPDMVEKVHQDYLAAGAMVLLANTFGANAARLARFGLEGKVGDIVTAGVRIARGVAGDKAWVAGSMGPTGLIADPGDPSTLDPIREALRETAVALLDAGVDAIVLETFRSPLEMQVALETVRALGAGPLFATMIFDSDRLTGDGLTPEQAAMLLARSGADVVGANCGEGPSVLSDVGIRMQVAGRPVLIQPNAGSPRRVDGRVLYMATPEYFGEYAKRNIANGVRAVGGCCGTTPEHIRQIAAEVRMVSGGRIQVAAAAPLEDVGLSEVPVAMPLAQRSALGSALAEGFVVSVEVDPPPGIDPTKAIEGARLLKAAGVRFVNIADGPRATVRMSPLALGVLLQREVGIEPILHVTCRDRNLLGLQSDLLGAHSLGLHDLLIVTGDPAKLGDYPNATTVYDLDSVGLLRLVGNLNRGIEPSGRRMKAPTAFVKGCGAEPGAQDITREVDRLHRKVDAGAEYVMTQPVFDAEVMTRFLDRAAGIGVPIVLGLLPLASFRNAEFLHNEVPGMSIPPSIRERMRVAGSGPSAREEGIRIARETALLFLPRVQGLYIMPPFDRYETAVAVLEGLPIPSAKKGFVDSTTKA
jgi:homocysteine S-methyltransferase